MSLTSRERLPARWSKSDEMGHAHDGSRMEAILAGADARVRARLEGGLPSGAQTFFSRVKIKSRRDEHAEREKRGGGEECGECEWHPPIQVHLQRNDAERQEENDRDSAVDRSSDYQSHGVKPARVSFEGITLWAV